MFTSKHRNHIGGATDAVYLIIIGKEDVLSGEELLDEIGEIDYEMKNVKSGSVIASFGNRETEAICILWKAGEQYED